MPLLFSRAHYQVLACFVMCIININNYATLKQIVHLSFWISYLAPVSHFNIYERTLSTMSTKNQNRKKNVFQIPNEIPDGA